MNWISRSLSICKFFCSSSQMFGHIGVLKNYAKFTRKYQCWSRFLIKLQFSYFQPSTFIKKETPAQVLSYESCENFKNTFFIEQPPRDCFRNCNVVKVLFLIHCTLFIKLRLPKSMNLISLKSYY